MDAFGPLISTQWLADHLGTDNVKVVDASWRMPGEGSAREDYLERHIPGAAFFDIDAVADRRSDLPHMLASVAQFEAAVGAMGIGDGDRVVVYDDRGFFSAPRVWWNFRVMGHEAVAVLDGGLPAWREAGRPLAAGAATAAGVPYFASFRTAMVASAADVAARIATGRPNIADARPAGRFAGVDPEPRPGLRRGHMPGAMNAPLGELVDERGRLLAPEALKARFEEAGLDLSAPVVTTCGSGVTAAGLLLALDVVGCRGGALYDGAWAEWGDERRDPARFPVVAAT